MNKKLLCYTLFPLSLALQVTAQEKSKIKFGNVTEKDFASKVYPVDSNANAVVIADIGSSNIEGNNKAWFSLVYRHFKRVHILNKNGYDIANVSISLYSDGDDEEQLDKLKAVTYNLENGKVVETKLDIKNNVFKDKISKNRVTKKFTFPNVKEGSIIEYEYTITSDFLSNLQPWEFQGAYPRLWSEYNLSIPVFLGYVFLTQGYKTYDIKNKESHSEAFNIADSRSSGATERFTFTAFVDDYRWVIKNVPPLKEESYTSTIDNHITKIEFQLSEYRDPLRYRNIMGSWPKLTEDLMNSEFFGQQVTKDNGWLKDIIGPVVSGSVTKADKAKKIFAYVRDNFTCTSHDRFFMDQTLKGLVKTHNGTVAEINLLLTAMMKYADIEADPVILSTRSNGYTLPMYPLLSKFNYVICRVAVDDKKFYLDASEPHIGFGQLPLRCYNGHARVVNKIAEVVQLNSDELAETKITSIFIINDEKGNLIGSVQQTPGYYESNELRDRVKEKGREQLQKDIKKDFGADIVISNFQIDSLDKYENELGIHYDFDIKDEKEDIMYFTPLFGEGFKENPFKSAERFYPVEMPYAMDETVNLQLEVPVGYVVDELPKSVIVKMNEREDGMFEYRISQSGDNISLRSRIRFKRAFFMPEEYETLREFFNLIVSKQAEQIVFKKKK
ncbi:MAG TPA: DUF3857 domain-containing protein [Chitinophagaceae bacterium]|nr:DUF3857 domain-containing protein [Chitinophagaceae bacterium]